jgi:hypothetical protein
MLFIILLLIQYSIINRPIFLHPLWGSELVYLIRQPLYGCLLNLGLFRSCFYAKNNIIFLYFVKVINNYFKYNIVATNNKSPEPVKVWALELVLLDTGCFVFVIHPSCFGYCEKPFVPCFKYFSDCHIHVVPPLRLFLPSLR